MGSKFRCVTASPSVNCGCVLHKSHSGPICCAFCHSSYPSPCLGDPGWRYAEPDLAGNSRGNNVLPPWLDQTPGLDMCGPFSLISP